MTAQLRPFFAPGRSECAGTTQVLFGTGQLCPYEHAPWRLSRSYGVSELTAHVRLSRRSQLSARWPRYHRSQSLHEVAGAHDDAVATLPEPWYLCPCGGLLGSHPEVNDVDESRDRRPVETVPALLESGLAERWAWLPGRSPTSGSLLRRPCTHADSQRANEGVDRWGARRARSARSAGRRLCAAQPRLETAKKLLTTSNRVH